MQRKAYVPGATVLLAALLAGCTGSSGNGGEEGDSKAGDTTASATAAQPGKYRTLPEACAAVDHSSLDSLLPGIEQLTDEQQREKAYAGEATQTYDTDRKVGCRWKVESTDATDHLFVDFERVVSYDNSVSDAARASKVYTAKEDAADLPEPSRSDTAGSGSSAEGSTPQSTPSGSAGDTGSDEGTPSGSATASGTPADLQPRTLDGLGDEAFLDDQLSTSGSTAQQRTVTVVFRTSNVVVTIEYEEQPAQAGAVPDSEESQDRALKLAQDLVAAFNA
ncbi:DUF3558 domain-containing protein [Streptomyces sp. NPDC058274]|uniref:DUF3558 domain-containing protein n=1 Tax=Streptomyces sp. NPDC058274 TaxID=3346416 RepID=UPI0036E07365